MIKDLQDAKSGECRSNRGQFILLTAVVFSILLLATLTIGNAAVFSVWDIASGPQQGATMLESDLTEAELAAAQGIRSVNTDPTVFTESDRRDLGKERIEVAMDSRDATGIIDGKRTNITLELPGITDGTRIVQNSPAPITDTTDGADWILVSSASDVRAATFDFTNEGSSSSNLSTVSDPGTGPVFTVRVSGTADGASESVDVAVYETPEGMVELNYTVAGTDELCETPANETVRFSAIDGTLSAGSCPNYPMFESVEELRIIDGDQASGTYSVVGTADVTPGSNVGFSTTAPSPASASDPVEHHAIYSVEATITVRGPSGRMSRTSKIAPGTVTPEGAI